MSKYLIQATLQLDISQHGQRRAEAAALPAGWAGKG